MRFGLLNANSLESKCGHFLAVENDDTFKVNSAPFPLTPPSPLGRGRSSCRIRRDLPAHWLYRAPSRRPLDGRDGNAVENGAKDGLYVVVDFSGSHGGRNLAATHQNRYVSLRRIIKL